MNFLIIGLGSMGKRRIRNLHALQLTSIFGFDPREDRRKEAGEKYGIVTFESFQEAISSVKFDALVISVPPDKHHIYMKEAINLNVPFFVEASVVDDDMDIIIQKCEQKQLLAAPSSTMYFHPSIQKIKEIVEGKQLGKITNILYHSGQYLPDWHTYEAVRDFYVSKRETGGAREIVPFELTWLVKIFGFPSKVTGFYKKTINIEGADQIDDTYNGLFDYGSFLLNLSVDVVSRNATRKLTINGSEAQLQWDWNDDFIMIFEPGKDPRKIEFQKLAAQSGYNKNITEQMYIDEMKCFVDAVAGKGSFVNNLADDHKVLKLLYQLEHSQNSGKIIVL